MPVEATSTMDADTTENYELLFLIVKFLRDGFCPEAASLLEKELVNPNRSLLPQRIDWQGNPHSQTFSDLERQFPHVSAQHITALTSWLRAIPRTVSVPGPRSLLSLPGVRPGPVRLLTPMEMINNQQFGLTKKQSHTKISMYSSVYERLQLQRRSLGHLSSVFCLLFDKTGHYIFTGADDLLVKMWGTYNGRLYFTFRGASAEISDMAVSEDNRLLAAGSTDKIIRVWCLISAAPLAVLSKHTGTITALHFCPCVVPGVPPYLAATSGDGTVSFWKYQYKDKAKKRAIFDPEPTRYHEKMRPGGAQMICAAFSPGGLFLATGSADHHVRVYIMDGKEGPGKVLEQEAHTERVDSIQWANSPVLRFISGSKDGTARIWAFRSGSWNSAVLKITAADGRTVHFNKEKKIEEPLRVTMVNWCCDDSRVITAVSDSSLCIWCPNTAELLQRLQGHKDEVYVLEPHPILPTILMSGAHDGNLIIWDMEVNKVIFQHHNNIDGQGHGAIYDAKWCPDNLFIAASDSHGHVLYFSANTPETQGLCYNKCPEEMFFHTDYRPLLRDTAHHVVDEQTQCAPHLLPPPFLVDVEGNPYPADIQRLVPGREHLSDREALVPNDEPSPLSPLPVVVPVVARPPSAARRSVDTAETPREQPVSNIDVLIAELAANVQRSESRSGSRPSTDSRSEAALPPPIPEASPNPNLEHSYAVGGAEQSEAAGRPSIVMPAPASQQLVGSVWRRRNLIKPGKYKSPVLDVGNRKARGVEEKKFFRSEDKKKHTSGHSGTLNGHHEGIVERLNNAKRGKGGKARGGGRTRASAATAPRPASGGAGADVESPDDDDDADRDFNHSSVTDSSLSESDMEGPSGTSSDSTEYSDWGANNLTPPQRTARKSGKAATTSQPASSEDEAPKPGPSRYFKRKKYNFDPTHLEEIPPEYLPSPWLAEYIPKKTPYFPQMGDEVMYFKQGHMGYINLVKHRNCYKLNMREQQWRKRDDLKEVELVKVVGMKYDIRPPRLCCLKLAVMDREDNQLTGHNFSIKYHDMNDVVDFLVLRHIYETAMTVKWNSGDRYRCQIEDGWWYGSVLGVTPFDPNIPDSPFLSVLCLWDSGEEERLSPWDLDLISEDGVGSEKVEDQVPVTKKEIERHLYQPLAEEWRGLDSKSEGERISSGLEQVMALAHAENFNYPVDLTLFPDYMLEIEYPMDFSLIKSRLDNQFYRRSTAAQFDVRYIATNAECYNRPKTDIVKDARILTDLVLRIIQDPRLENITGEYHSLVENFNWEDTQEPSKKAPKAGRKSTEQKDSPNPKQWKHDCNELVNKILEMEDSRPFREPVNDEDFPDYNRLITTPMDLTLVIESLRVGEYENPLDFQKDMMLMFSNSFQYNTNKKSKVLGMTKRLKAHFLDEFQGVISNWRRVNRRIGFLKKKGTSKSPKSTPMKKTPSKKKRRTRKKEEQYETEGTDDEEDKSSKKKTGKRKLSLDDSDSEEEKPRYKGKGKGKGKSSKAIKKSRQEPVMQEQDDSESDDDIPISKRRDKPKASPQKKSVSKPAIKSKKSRIVDSDDELSEESEEEPIEETPDESSEVDEDLPGFKEDKLFERNKKKRRRSTSDSDPEEGNSRGARPKRSAKARVIRDDSEESEPEEKVPYKRKITPKGAESAGSFSKQKSKCSEDSGGRPRRQATEKALNKFQDGSSSDGESLSTHKAATMSPKKSVVRSSDSTDPRPKRQASGKSALKFQDDTESDGDVVAKHISPRKKKPVLPPSETVSEDSNPEPVPARAKKSRSTPAPRHHNSVSSSHGVQTDTQPGPSSAGVTISAADSSTDLSRKRNARTASKFPSSIPTDPNSPEDQNSGAISEPGLSEGGTSTRRPQRKIVKPIRLQDYSDDEEMREAKRKNGVPVNEPKKEKSKKPKKSKKRKKRSSEQEDLRPARSDRYKDDDDEGSESELLSQRLKKSRKSSGKSKSRRRDGERKISASDYMLSPKAKRSKSNVNYRDESDSLSEPIPPQPKRTPSKVKATALDDRKEKREVDSKDESGSEGDEPRKGSKTKKSPKKSKSGSRKEHSANREKRRKDPVKYEEYSYESGDIDDEEIDAIKELKDMAAHDRSDSSGDSESGLTIKYDTGDRDSEEDDRGNQNKSEHEDRVDGLLASLEALADSEEQEVDSEEDLGKRRGSRRRLVSNNTSSSVRPQRSAGQSARPNFREDSTDDDLPPKRHHRPKPGPSGMGRGRGLLTRGGGHSGVAAAARPPSDMTESSDSNDDDDDDYEADAPGGSGVSSRGRVRRPNPKLME
eukprot:GFUD01004614.1.p1 GENE.GFUD01004614.1~~GFUD01004614.1.p1  ORF type:complete len:2283 (-),score=565.95 GFUD01004614.1:61-6909(-)